MDMSQLLNSANKAVNNNKVVSKQNTTNFMQNRQVSNPLRKVANYSKDYPGLNKTSYDKMVSKIDKLGLTGDARKQALDEEYRNNVKYYLNDQTLEERDNYINEQAYQAAQLKDKQATAQLKMTQLSQLAKKQWNLDATADDLEVFSTIAAGLGEEGTDLIGKYLSGESDELRYKLGLETTGEKREDRAVGFIQSPAKWGYNIVGQRIDKGAKGITEKVRGSELGEKAQEGANNIVRWFLKKQGLSDEEIENEINAFVAERDASLENGTAFNGREQTDIRTPILGEDRANSKYTKQGEVAGDIATGIAMTAPLAAVTAPVMAESTVLGAGLLGGMEGILDTALTHYGSQGDLDLSTGEMLLGAGGGAAGGIFTRYLANLPKNTQQAVREEAAGYIEKSIKPTVKGKMSQAEYNGFIDDTLDVANFMSKNKDMLQYTDDLGNTVTGKMPTNLRETSEVLNNMKKTLYDTYNKIAQEAGDAGARVNMNKIYQQLDDLTKDVSQNIANPGTDKVISQFKNQLLQYTDDAGTIAIEDAQKLTQDFNKQLSAFFKNPNMNDVSKNAIVAQMNRGVKDAINDSIDDVLNKSIEGGSNMSRYYTDLKGMYGKIKTIEDEVSKRALVEARKNLKGLSNNILDALAGGEFTQGLLSADLPQTTKAVVMKAISKYYKYLNDPNVQWSNLIDLVEKTNNPSRLSSTINGVKGAIKGGVKNNAGLIGGVIQSPGVVSADIALTNN